MDWAKSTARQDEKHLSFGIWCVLFERLHGISITEIHILAKQHPCINPLRLSDAHMHWWSGSPLDQVMDWRLFAAWTNAESLSVRPLGKRLSQILIEIQMFSLKKMHLKMLPAKCYLSFNVLTHYGPEMLFGIMILVQHWLGWLLLSSSAPSHYLDKCCLIVNWTPMNKFQWNFNQSTKHVFHDNAYIFEFALCKMLAILNDIVRGGGVHMNL